MKRIRQVMDVFKQKGLYPFVHVATSPCDREMDVDGKKILMFGSYNYLGLANHPKIKQAIKDGLEKYGVGAGGVRLLSGTYDIHLELEKEVASLTRHEAALTIPSGFGTNTGVIPGFMNLLGLIKKSPFVRKGIILSDQLNHASIVDGARLSYAKTVPYKHVDILDLEKKLKKYKSRRKLIITDGVFSMDGDVAPLARIVELAKHYNALTMVDDAHAFGVIGDSGSGSAEYCGVAGQIDINMGTFSKGLGIVGGFVSGSKEMIEYLRIATRSYVFSDAIPPSIACGIKKAIDLIKEEPERRINVIKKANNLRGHLEKLGFYTYGSTTQIVPVQIGKDEDSIKASEMLFERNIYIPAVRWPAVPKNDSRLRLAVMANHTQDDIEKLIDSLKEVAYELGVLKK